MSSTGTTMVVRNMDKLTEQLKADAELIEVQVSDALDRRINASLRATDLNAADSPTAPTAPNRPAWFWWASSLTGVAAALIIVAMVNSQPKVPDTLRATPTASLTPVASTP